MATQASGEDSTAPQSFAQKEAVALLVVLQHACNSDVAADACLLVASTALVAFSSYKRPRITATLAIVWLAWFVCKFAQDQSAWLQVVDHAADARYATENTFRAVGAMLVAWFILGMPIILDVERLLSPCVIGIVKAWEGLSWQGRGIVVLCFSGSVSAVIAGVIVWRHQDMMRFAIFQLSFFLVGLLVWWLTMKIPHECGIFIACMMIYIVPVGASLHVLLDLQRERDTYRRQRMAETKNWFAWEGVQQEDEALLCDELVDRMRLWLSYWSCWPFFHIVYMLLKSTDLVSSDKKSAADGVLVALVVWAQFWQASRVSFYFYKIFETCLTTFLEKFQETFSKVPNLWATQTLLSWSEKLRDVTINRWVLIGFVVAIALAIASIALETIAVAQSFVTLAIVVAAAVDSAGCVAQIQPSALSSRLSFWVLAMGWIWLRCLPLLDLFTVWTPLVLIAAFVAGDTLVNAALHAARAAARAATAWLSGDSGQDDAPTTGPDGSTLVPQAEENPMPLSDGSPTNVAPLGSSSYSPLRTGLVPAE